MAEVTRSVHVQRPRQAVWRRLSDLGSVADYSPNVASSHWTSEARVGVGASRHCDVHPRGAFEERAVAWDDQRGYTLEVSDGLPPVIRQLFVTFSLSADEQTTTVVQTMRVETRYGWFGRLMGWAMQGQLRKAIDANLEGLKRACECEG